ALSVMPCGALKPEARSFGVLLDSAIIYPKTDNIARTFLINIPNKDNFFKKIVFLRDYDTR
ncbi:MAG: hypothetical protein WC949_05000, partial [Candidatus Paceibacterota bacterium]